MTDLAALNTANTWTDLSGFGALRHTAQTDAKSALPIVAKQFESIFTQMMLKSMREASPKDELTESTGGDQWRDMFDQQLSVSLTQHGKGIGIAEMLIRQLGGHDASAQPDGSGVGGSAAGGFSGQGGKNDDWKDRLVALADATRKAGKSVAKWIPADIGEFVRDLAPHAVEAAKRLGVSLRVVLAQAALETQYGKHMPVNRDGTTSFNLFGIKAGASWDGAKVSVPTLEYENGVPVRRQANFRAYESPAHSFSDFADLIGNSARYAGAIGKGDDALAFGRALVQGGYATDPSYASKIAQIANSPAMRNALEALKQSVGLPNQ